MKSGMRDWLGALLSSGERERQRSLTAAIDRSQAVIEFSPDGTVLDANENFLSLLGYSLDELRGQHHSVLCTKEFALSTAYRDLWTRLRAGEFHVGECPRIAKDGRDVWLQASYNPVLDRHSQVARVVKIATDITAYKVQALADAGKVAAIGKAHAVIEFGIDGSILDANDAFLDTFGYSLAEIRGQHHRIFCETEYAQSPDYREFWNNLASGRYESGQYLRVAKDGRRIWVEATYNPILDARGRPTKILKIATDISAQKEQFANFSGQLAAIAKSQAVIEFDLDGTIRTANDNFLATLGYSLAEIKGQHHRMFCEPAYAKSSEYQTFWKRLGGGQYDAGQYLRLGKGGRPVWIQATYNPILDAKGNPYKVVKFASDITAQRTMLDTMSRIVAEVKSAAVSVRASAQEVARGNDDLSQRTQEQAASLEEAASSMNELTATVRGNANNAAEADRLAREAQENAESGGRIVGGAVEAMKAVSQAST